MSVENKAVFLSYASQDAEAAKRICDALRAAGVEVWFDQSELRGGDSWDAKIRRQIKECALFVPVISANTQARPEGYFRLEWKLAVDRSHLLADDHPFLFPVVIDDTPDAGARVPEKFRDVQWTRLNVKDTPETLAARVGKLLSGAGASLDDARGRRPAIPRRGAQPAWLRYAWAGVGLLFAVIYALRPFWQAARHSESKPAVVAPAAPAAQLSEARQLTAKAQAMSLDKYDSTADDFAAAEGLLKQALALDQNDGEIWAFSSLFNTSMRTRGFDHAPVRREMARRDAERALKLAPDSFGALYALGRAQRDFEPEAAEQTFNRLLARKPDDASALGNLAWIYDQTGRVDEAAAIYERLVTAEPARAALNRYTEFLLFFHYNRLAEADRCIRQSVALQPSANSQGGLAMLLLSWKGDADEAARVLATGPTASRNEPRTIWITAFVDLCRRAPDHALKTLDRLADDFILDNWFAGPKAYFTGRAHQLGGRPEAARIAWESALAITNAHLKDSPGDLVLHLMRGQLLAFLGQSDEALREAHAVAELARGDDRHERYWFSSPALIYAALGRADEAVPLLEKLSLAPPGQIVGWPLTPALLRLDPIWDRIRDDPRFQALCAEPAAPKAEDRSWKTERSAQIDQKSVAVLAFANLSDDKANEYFSDGISEELLNVLAKVPGLKVTARTSSFHFKGRDTPIPEIARQLGVAYVIEGSVRKQGDKVRITAQLIKAADGFNVWSNNFDRELKDIFAVQDEIAGLIANQFSLKLGRSSAAATASVNPQALEFYLQANQLMRLRDTIFTNTDRVEELLNRALALEPDFARAQAMLAEVWSARRSLQSSRGSRFGQRHSPERARIEAKARQAIALDPTVPEPHVALSLAMWTWWDLAGAQNELRTALSLNPSHVPAHRQLGLMAMDDGRMDDAIAELSLAVQLDPFSQSSIEALARVLHVAGRYTEAIATYDRALALADSEVAREHKAYALAQLGQKEAALALAHSLSLDWLRFRTFAAAGARAEAEKVFPTAEPENRAYYLFMLGRTEEGLAALDPDEMQSTYLHDVFFEPWFDPVREDPRFTKFLDTLGVTEAHARAQAWRKAHPPEKGEAKK